MPFRKATPQETKEWLGSGRVMLGPRPASPLPENATPSGPVPQEWLDELVRMAEASLRAQDAYQLQLQSQSATDGPPTSPKPTQHCAGEPGLEPGERLPGCRHHDVEE
jgi:hypothetical protein